MSTLELLRDTLGKDIIKDYQLKPGKSFEKMNKIYRHIIESLINHSSDKTYTDYIKKRYLELYTDIQNTRYDNKLTYDIMWFYERGIVHRLTKSAANYVGYKRSLENINKKIDSHKDSCNNMQIKGALTRLNKRRLFEEEMLTEYENYIKDTIEYYIIIMIKCSSK